MRPVIAAFGEWNTTNLGDRAIYDGVQAYFEEAGWSVAPFALGSLSRLPNLDIDSDIASAGRGPQTGTAQGRRVVNRTRRKVRAVVRPYRQRLKAEALRPHLAGVQAVLIGGGELLTDRRSHFSQSLKALSRVFQRLDLPVLCLGCSIAEEWTPRGRRAIAGFIRECDLIATRDLDTANAVRGVLNGEVSLFGDFALPLPIRGTTPDALGRGRLAVNVRALISGTPREQFEYEQCLVELVSRYLSAREAGGDGTPSVSLFTTGSAEDRPPTERVLQRLGDARVLACYPANLPELRSLLRTSSTVVAGRLHSAILAIAEGTPVIGASPSPKIRRFFETIGLERFAVSLPRDGVDVALEMLLGEALARQSEFISVASIDTTRANLRERLRKIAALRPADEPSKADV